MSDIPGIDTTVANVARIYDYLLGGKDNFEADRAAAARILELIPGSAEACRLNREFLVRVVTHLASHGVRQFLDLGSGLPTRLNVHQIARHADRDARVVYVDYNHCKLGCVHPHRAAQAARRPVDNLSLRPRPARYVQTRGREGRRDKGTMTREVRERERERRMRGPMRAGARRGRSTFTNDQPHSYGELSHLRARVRASARVGVHTRVGRDNGTITERGEACLCLRFAPRVCTVGP